MKAAAELPPIAPPGLLEAELRKATAIKLKDKEPRAKFLGRLVRAVERLSNDEWGSLSDEAQDWANAGSDAIKAKAPVADFAPEPAEAEEEADEDTPVGTDEDDEPKGEPEASAPRRAGRRNGKAPASPEPEPEPLEDLDAKLQADAPPAPVDPGTPIERPRKPARGAKEAKGTRKSKMWSTPGASAYWRLLCVKNPNASKAELDAMLSAKNMVLAPGSKSVIRDGVKKVIRIQAELAAAAK